MSQTEVQLIKSSSVVDADIVGMSASKLSGTLPAISAANLTNLPAANLTGALPAISGASLTNLPAGGITLADQWRITSSYTGVEDPIANNWERNDVGWSQLGTGFSAPSSGIWTFPSTGYYWISFQANVAWTSSTNYIRFNIQYTANNSSYSVISSALGYINNVTDTTYESASTEVMLKITDTSNQKIKFNNQRYVGNESFTVIGDTNVHLTGATFIRMGDI